MFRIIPSIESRQYTPHNTGVITGCWYNDIYAIELALFVYRLWFNVLKLKCLINCTHIKLLPVRKLSWNKSGPSVIMPWPNGKNSHMLSSFDVALACDSSGAKLKGHFCLFKLIHRNMQNVTLDQSITWANITAWMVTRDTEMLNGLSLPNFVSYYLTMARSISIMMFALSYPLAPCTVSLFYKWK